MYAPQAQLLLGNGHQDHASAPASVAFIDQQHLKLPFGYAAIGPTARVERNRQADSSLRFIGEGG